MVAVLDPSCERADSFAGRLETLSDDGWRWWDGDGVYDESEV